MLQSGAVSEACFARILLERPLPKRALTVAVSTFLTANIMRNPRLLAPVLVFAASCTRAIYQPTPSSTPGEQIGALNQTTVADDSLTHCAQVVRTPGEVSSTMIADDLDGDGRRDCVFVEGDSVVTDLTSIGRKVVAPKSAGAHITVTAECFLSPVGLPTVKPPRPAVAITPPDAGAVSTLYYLEGDRFVALRLGQDVRGPRPRCSS